MKTRDQRPETRGRRAAQRERGFALIITLTLLAFVVLLLVGLATYTRIETAVAGNMQRQAQARENALLALNVALGELQKHAGPDTRATATAESVASVDPQKKFYTGVWDATTTGATPLAWLASGTPTTTETTAADGTVTATTEFKVTAPIPNQRSVMLVGPKSDGSTRENAVSAELMDIKVPGVPGRPLNEPPESQPVIGRYAWWVGDQGVKAPVAIAVDAAAVDYAPFADRGSVELRNRIGQQVGFGPGAINGDTPVFEPRDSNNGAFVSNNRILSPEQFALLRTPDDGAISLGTVRQNFHAWSPNNFAVLANTKTGELRQDLSLDPSLLGSAFAAWVNYPAYMEKHLPDPPPPETPAGESGSTEPTEPVTPTVPVGPVITGPLISPPYGTDPIRRRYVMLPHQFDSERQGSHQVAPVLTYFLLTFNVRAQPTSGNSPASTPQPLEVRARWMVSLWNPYTSALVPENLRIEIEQLPRSVEVFDDTLGGTVGQFSLSDSSSPFGGPFNISLPWNAGDAATAALEDDRQSWLPGRVHTWRSVENTDKTAPLPTGGFASEFESRTLADAGDGVIRALSFPDVDGDDECHLIVNGSETLLITLYAVRPEGDVVLGRYTSPAFLDSFNTDVKPIGEFGYQFSYVFRLGESIDNLDAPNTWLTDHERDPRRSRLLSQAFVVEAEGNNPAVYVNYSKISNPDRLLDRAANAKSYNEDVPLFELPRGPLLSMGALQHFRLAGRRPFMIGNPWGVNHALNNLPLGSLFDRFFFSGLADGAVPSVNSAGDLVLPNPLLKPLRKRDATKVTIDDVRALMNPPVVTSTDADGNEVTTPSGPPTSYSSKFFVQGGAFNVNSVNANAWAAVLRGVRYPTDARVFSYHNVSLETGTAPDDARATVPASADAQFFRFPQSAQETYKAEAGMAGDDPAVPSLARTELFRKGMRTLTPAQVSALAAKIAELVKVKHAAADPSGGPFRSLEEFLSPNALFGIPGAVVEGATEPPPPGPPRTLLEAAIEDTGINTGIEFSSQYLTQADVMTTLAPFVFPRSDTFVIRTYGEAVNPATNGVEGRAWCEAVVQRFPEYFDPSMPADTVPSGFEPVPNPDAPDEPPTATAAQQLNKALGRRFKVVSFRWLTRSDI